jgi:hypothetical protein
VRQGKLTPRRPIRAIIVDDPIVGYKPDGAISRPGSEHAFATLSIWKGKGYEC